MITISKIPLVPMGVLAPVSAHARPSARPPIDMSERFPPRMSAESPSNLQCMAILSIFNYYQDLIRKMTIVINSYNIDFKKGELIIL